MPFTVVLHAVTWVCRRIWRWCGRYFTGMACACMSKIILEGVVHVLKLMTPASCLKHLFNIKSGQFLQKVAKNNSSSGNEWLLVVFDHFNKFVQAFLVRNTSAVTLAKTVVDEYICLNYQSLSIHRDSGGKLRQV